MPVKVERHDGFYLRGGLGVAGIGMERSAEGSLYGFSGSRDSKISGVGGMFELSIGGTPAPGLVLAGTLLIHELKDPVLESDGVPDVDLGGPLTFAVLGGTVDWYPNPHGGFHLGGTLGLAAAVAKTPDNSPFDNIGGGGAALSVAVGYDWWVADEWSIGVLGRITGARVHGEESHSAPAGELKGTEDSSVSAVGLMFSVLYH